jgi:signal transduction histidine kinase
VASNPGHTDLPAGVSQRAQLIATVLAMPDPMVVTDPVLCVELMNKPFAEAFGIDDEKSRGIPLPDLISDTDILLAVELVRDDPEAGNQVWSVALPSQTGGRIRAFELKITRVEVDGHLTGLVVMLDEVTRYHELMDLKSDFVNTVSHQFRTPLASILLNASTLVDGYGAPGGQVPPEQAEVLRSIVEEIQRLGRMVNDLLDLSKLESGRARLQLQRVSLYELVETVLRSLAPGAQQKGVDLVNRVSRDHPAILADAGRLNWVVTNLVSNGIKHTSTGQVAVSSRISGWRAHISVEDTGSGIPEEYRSRLFERFFQVPGSEASQQGTGLGLAIAKEVVEAHGGRIWFDSEIGKGTTFTFTLMLAGVPAGRGDPPDHAGMPAREPKL